MESYELDKWNWTEQDFEYMGWHDCPIYAMRFDDQVALDIDYILKWNKPDIEGMPFTFWISPATLTFKEVTSFKSEFEMDFINGLEIVAISKGTSDGPTQWNIDTQQGTLVIYATSFEQVIRRKPTLQFWQYIQAYERGDISFSTSSEMNFQLEDSAEQKRKDEFSNYERVRKLNILRKEYQAFIDQRDATLTKEFLIRKRTFEKQISELTELLNETSFKGW
ncbi:MAG: hypothetical protein AAGA66_10660 [Bacteroidota bacterium]